VTVGISQTFVISAVFAAAALAAAFAVWPATDPDVLGHHHDDLDEDDPHWTEGGQRLGHRHAHGFVIDPQHPQWPRHG
jgi:hypothetical protein